MPRSWKIALICAALATAGFYFWNTSGGWPIVNSPPGAGPMIAFGDSLTAGTGSKAGETYPDFLGASLGVEVLNRGVPGDTAEDALHRLEEDVLGDKPGVVLVLLGGNDLLQRLNPDKTFGAIREIVTRSQDAGAMIVLIGIEGLPLVSADYGPLFESLARETGCVYVPDILDGLMGEAELMADGIHPNAKGYQIVAERIADKLRPQLEPAD